MIDPLNQLVVFIDFLFDNCHSCEQISTEIRQHRSNIGEFVGRCSDNRIIVRRGFVTSSLQQCLYRIHRSFRGDQWIVIERHRSASRLRIGLGWCKGRKTVCGNRRLRMRHQRGWRGWLGEEIQSFHFGFICFTDQISGDRLHIDWFRWKFIIDDDGDRWKRVGCRFCITIVGGAASFPQIFKGISEKSIQMLQTARNLDEKIDWNGHSIWSMTDLRLSGRRCVWRNERGDRLIRVCWREG